MQDLIPQIRAASKGGLYYVALFTSLAIPDICGALESEDGVATNAKYIDWFDRHVAPAYGGFFDGEACYLFRCSLLHQGSTQHPSSKYVRVLFVEPGATTNVFHNNIMNDALNIDVRIFCEDLCAAAERWLKGAQLLPHFETNFSKFARRYPTGLAPYIQGVPVVG